MMEKAELSTLLQNAVVMGIKRCINEGVVIGITPKYQQRIKTAQDMKKFYTPKQVCDLWNISYATLWRYENRGIIRGIRQNGSNKVLFEKEEIDGIESPRYRHEESSVTEGFENVTLFNIDPDYMNN